MTEYRLTEVFRFFHIPENSPDSAIGYADRYGKWRILYIIRTITFLNTNHKQQRQGIEFPAVIERNRTRCFFYDAEIKWSAEA